MLNTYKWLHKTLLGYWKEMDYVYKYKYLELLLVVSWEKHADLLYAKLVQWICVLMCVGAYLVTMLTMLFLSFYNIFLFTKYTGASNWHSIISLKSVVFTILFKLFILVLSKCSNRCIIVHLLWLLVHISVLFKIHIRVQKSTVIYLCDHYNYQSSFTLHHVM